MDFFDLPISEQRAAIQREQHAGLTRAIAEAQHEIQLLRDALNARQGATRHAQMTAAEIRLRAFEQARAAHERARASKRGGNDACESAEWHAIAADFERTGQGLTQGSNT